MKERSIGIDILKFLAILLITNTHLSFLYVKFSWLATGGVIGNALFFFCSGFTLFLKPFDRVADFPNWYKRRIIRIYPTVFAVAIARCLFFDAHLDIIDVILHGGRWFISAIMVMYVFLYFIGLYARHRLNWVMGALALVTVAWFYLMDQPFSSVITGRVQKFHWLVYFMFMLLGARVGMLRQDSKRQAAHQWLNLFLAVVCIALSYLMMSVSDRARYYTSPHLFSTVPLLFAVYFLYWACEGKAFARLYNNKFAHFLIRFMGGLCLEIYLVQNLLFTDKLNFLFPLNIPMFFVIVVLASYLCRCLARIILQTFQKAPYDWKKVFSLY